MKPLYQNNFIPKILNLGAGLFILSVFLLLPNLSLAQTAVSTGGGWATILVPGLEPIVLAPTPTDILNSEDVLFSQPVTPNTTGLNNAIAAGQAYDVANPNGSGGDTQSTVNSDYAESIGGRITLFLYGIFVSIGGLFAWFGGLALDYSIYEFLILMGQKLNGNFGIGLNSVWTTIRDVFNLIFIFALIWMGIKTILNSDDSSVKKSLGLLIVAALLINFSLLISKAVVDFTNIAAYQIYQSITVTQNNGGRSPFDAIYTSISGDTAVSDRVSDRGTYEVTSISGAFMQQFNLATYANPGDGNSTLSTYVTSSGASGISWKLIGFGILIMFMMMLAGFVFLSGAYLILHRFVVLIIYMMLSPAMFLGWIYPGLDSHAKKWRDGFFKNAFVAPAYLFLVYVALRMSESMTNGGSNMNFGNAYQSSGNGDAFAVFVYFFVMCGFLIAASRAAQIIGASGADMTAKLGNMGVKTITGIAAGGAARIGRGTIGYGAQKFVDSSWAKKNLANKWYGRSVQAGVAKVADSSFEVRQVPGMDKIKVGGQEIDLGTGKKGGMTTRIKEDSKKATGFADWLGEDEAAAKLATLDIIKAQNDKEAEIEAAKNTHKRDLSVLDSELNRKREEYGRATTDKAKERIMAEINDIKDRKRELNEKHKDAILEPLEKELSKLKEEYNKADSKARYNRQIAYMKYLQKSSERFNSLASRIGVGGVLGTSSASALLAGGLGASLIIPSAVVGAVGSSAAAGEGYTASQARSAVIKKYGKDGEKAKKSKEDESELKKIKEKLKEGEEKKD